MLVMAGLLSAHFFGLRLFELTKAKLGASDEARAAISTLIQEIRSAKLLRIGDGSLSTFTEVGVDSLRLCVSPAVPASPGMATASEADSHQKPHRVLAIQPV